MSATGEHALTGVRMCDPARMHVDNLGTGCNISLERGVLRGYFDPKSQKGLRGTGIGRDTAWPSV